MERISQRTNRTESVWTLKLLISFPGAPRISRMHAKQCNEPCSNRSNDLASSKRCEETSTINAIPHFIPWFLKNWKSITKKASPIDSVLKATKQSATDLMGPRNKTICGEQWLYKDMTKYGRVASRISIGGRDANRIRRRNKKKQENIQTQTVCLKTNWKHP